MIIGIDVGGTHTDGVLIHEDQVIKTSKVNTNRKKLNQSVLSALDQLLTGQDHSEIERIVFSTTLTTNLIAQEDYPPTGLVLIPGPGISPEWLQLGTKNWILSGSIDHRGRMVAELDVTEVNKIIQDLHESDIQNLAIVGKFSTRNPLHEERLATQIKEVISEIDNIQLGNQVAPRLNFPRRVQTTWLNTAVYHEYAGFLQSVKEAIQQRGIQAKLYLLKADGGTMPLDAGLTHGVETIKSGPAASIMGFLALVPNEDKTALLLDVGGTTTDIAFMTGGTPLFEPEGVQIEGYSTTVRGLLNRSIPYGGDSPVIIDDTGSVDLLPRRVGPAMIFGGEQPTLTDALALLGLIQSEISEPDFEKAQATFPNLSGKTLEETANLAVQVFHTKVKQAVQELLTELNGQPVYTIHELLEDDKLQPEVVMMVGGPAKALLPGLAKELQMTPVLPTFHHVANALGAAVARPTLRQTLYADTAQRFYRILGTPGKKKITSHFPLSKARSILLEETEQLYHQMAHWNVDSNLVEITHEETFNIIRGFSTQGQIFKLEAQVKPGISTDFIKHMENSTQIPTKGGIHDATTHSKS